MIIYLRYANFIPFCFLFSSNFVCLCDCVNLLISIRLYHVSFENDRQNDWLAKSFHSIGHFILSVRLSVSISLSLSSLARITKANWCLLIGGLGIVAVK